MADVFADPTDLATLLQQDVDTASATLALELATGVLQETAGWRILEETVTGLAVVPTGSVLTLPTVRLTALTVTDAGLSLTQGSTVWWTPNGLVQRVWGPYLTPIPWRTPVVVTFTHGWGAGELPQQLRALCLSVASRIYDNPTGNRQETVGGATEIKTTGGTSGFALAHLTPEERTALLPYILDPVVVLA